MAGNANSGRKQEKPFRDALRMEIAAAGENHKVLRAVARALLEKATEGDMQAIKELADRTDGKVAQAIDQTNTHEVGDTLREFMERIAERGSRIY